MNAWTFVMKEFYFEEIKNREEIPWNSPNDIKKDDIIFVYSTSPKKYINYILKAISDPYNDPEDNSRIVRIKKEIEIAQPVTLDELKEDPILSKWAPINKKNFIFQGAHHKMSEQEYKQLINLILMKNPGLKVRIEKIETSDEIFGIRKFLETIFKHYTNIRGNKEKVKGHELSKLFSNKFPKYLEELSNKPSITNNQHNYRAFSHYQGAGGWFKTPWTILYDKEVEKLDKYKQYPYYIHYIFKEDIKKAYLGISLSWSHAKEVMNEKNPDWTESEREDYFNIKKAEIMEKLEKSIDIPNEFNNDFDQSPWITTSIYGKTYDAESVPSEKELENDFIELLKIYNQLIDLEYRHIKTDNFNIWKIAPGNYEKRKIMWPIFEKKGYIGVGWFLCEDLKKKNYKSFKNYEEVYDLLKKCANRPTVGISARMIWNFANEIQKGDIVIANNGYKGILGIGIIKSDYIGPYESNKLHLDPEEDYFHFREVEWIITDPVEVEKDYFFAQQTITPLNLQKWNKIKETYLNTNSKNNYKDLFEKLEGNLIKNNNEEIIKFLFHEFNKQYFQTPEGLKHHAGYKKEQKVVLEYYNQIKENENIIQETSGNIINYLLPIKRFSVAPVGFNDIKAVRHTDKNLPEFTKAVFNLITSLINSSDKTLQKNLINSFKSGKYEKGIQTAVLSSVLYYLNDDYWYINNKTVDTFNFLSRILNENEKINGILFDYIDNLDKLKHLIRRIQSVVPELSDFPTFDAFCHWMCDDTLGNYARDNEKYEYWYFNKFGELGYYLENFWIRNDEKLSNEFNKYLINIANSLNTKLSFNSKSFDGKYPHAILYSGIENQDYPYYISYFFNNNDIFLSLNLNKRFLRTILEKEKKYPGSLFDKDKIFEKILDSLTHELRKNIVTNTFTDSLNLGLDNSKIIALYQKSAIITKGYTLNSLPSEEQLQEDFKEIFESYIHLNNSISIETLIKDHIINSVIPDNFFQYLKINGYFFQPELVENFLLSLKIKPFVILTGNAGTGKTKLAQLFAQYISRLDPSRYEIIPVGANWTENRHIVGYYNVISNKYQKTAALELILRADDSNKPFFLILDEMNLSHVERYFSDFLSSMESGEPMPLINKELDDIDDMDLSFNVPEKLYIPSNLFIVGTVNVDETTYMFSPKVLDRANTMEFTTQSAKDFMLNSFNSIIPDTDYTYLQNPLSDIHVRDYSINQLKELLIKIKTEDDHSLWDVLAGEMDSLSDILKDAGFDFGFRTITEIIRFMYVSWIYDGENDQWINWRRFFDTQIYQKILPKVHGSHRELDSVLIKLFNHCYNGDFEDETWYTAKLDENGLLYPDSARKLQMMGKILQEKRYVSFTG